MDTLTRTATTGMYTDQYELTMLTSAVADGTVDKPAVFEVFARALPDGHRYGVFAGLGRILDALDQFGFDLDDIDWMLTEQIIDQTTAEWLRAFDGFTGQVDALPEGAPYLPHMPVMTVTGTFGECLLLETIVLSIVNHDSAVATVAAHIADAAGGKPILEMGTRRTHDEAAVAAARAAHIGGFTATSNLAAGRRYGIPTAGTAAHAWTLAHPGPGGEAAAFRTQIATQGVDTTLLVDTYDIDDGIHTAVAVANESGAAGPGAIRIDSGDPHVTVPAARDLLDRLGAHDTQIVVSGDLDADSIAALEAASVPVDRYGVGTKAVAGLAPPGFVYKLVQIDHDGAPVPVAKSSVDKATVGGRKTMRWVRGDNGQVAAIHIAPATVDVDHDDAEQTIPTSTRRVYDHGARTIVVDVIDSWANRIEGKALFGDNPAATVTVHRH